MVPEYRGHQQRRGLSPRTIEKDIRCVGQFLEFVGDDLDAVTPDAVEAFLLTRHLSARTRYWWLSTIHTFYRWAIRNGYATTDPTERIERPKLTQNLPRPIATADLAFALSSAPPVERAVLSLMAFEGLRAQEVAGLRRDDVLDTIDPPMLFVTKGKGGKQRAVPLHDDTASSLRVLPMPRTGYIFGDVPPWKISALVNRYLHGLGIDATGHQLRHWYATECYRDSHDLRMVQELLGHSSPSTTAIYTKLDMAAAAPVVQRLSAMARHPTALGAVAGGQQESGRTVTNHRGRDGDGGTPGHSGADGDDGGGTGEAGSQPDGAALSCD